jgi:hypothetical protein
MENEQKEPKFPLRIIFDDGQCDIIDAPEQLLESQLSIDSRDPANGVWVRDDLDRSIGLRSEMGQIVVLEVMKQ